MKYVDLGYQTQSSKRTFGFYCQLTESFKSYNGKTTWTNVESVVEDFKQTSSDGIELGVLLDIIPSYVPEKIADVRNMCVRKVYTVEVTIDEDNIHSLRRDNDGFTVIEILGVASLVSQDMAGMINSGLRPYDEVKRTATNSKFIEK